MDRDALFPGVLLLFWISIFRGLSEKTIPSSQGERELEQGMSDCVIYMSH
jgi:hypothetical protein